MKRSEGSSLGYYTICIAMLFLAGFLLLVVFGAQSYRNTVAEQNSNMSSRALLSYITTCARANDSENAVSIRSFDGNQMLVIADGTTGYATFIYPYDGRLMEQYAALDADPVPEDSQALGETELFEISELRTGVYSVTTDAGRALLHMRSEGGAGQ